MISKETIELLKNTDPLSILNYYNLNYKKSGQYLLLKCPIHNGNDYNFKININTKYYSCYSHGCVNGSVINFVMEMENVNFVKACEILSNINNVNIEQEDVNYFSYTKRNIENKLKKYIEKDDNNKNDLITEKKEENKKVNIIIPENNGTNHPFIINKNFKKETLDLFEVFYNKKMNRIVFLIRDFDNKIVGWKARAISEKDLKIKKFDSPYGFNSGDFFYGGNITLKHILEKRKVILVEGHWDVLRLYEKGYKNVLGIMGSNLTKTHKLWLKNNVHTIYPAFDPDNGGEKAFIQTYKDLYKDLNIIPIILPNKKDPEELTDEEFEKFFYKTK